MLNIDEMTSRLGQLDAIEWLQQQDAASIDLVVTDIPYESLEKHRSKGTTTRLSHSKASSNNWFAIFPNERLEELFAEIYRVLKPNTHFYFMCDQETMFIAKPLAEAAGFKFWKSIVWDKERIGMGYHYRSRHEMVLFFEKGKRKLNDLGIPDVVSFPRINGGYPTEKPTELYELLIKQSTNEGELVADPFFGSGSGLVACYNTEREFIGNDISPDAHDYLADFTLPTVIMSPHHHLNSYFERFAVNNNITINIEMIKSLKLSPTQLSGLVDILERTVTETELS